MLSRGTAVLCIDAEGATWVDFASGDSAQPDRPPGLGSFGDVAGGAGIEAPDGVTFVVGGTRDVSRGATAAVLRVDASGSLAAFALSAPRAGAAAAWIDGVGLVVAGGSEDGPGAEALLEGATAFSEVPLPPDPIAGAALVVTGGDDVLLVGGTTPAGDPAPGRLFDPRCASSCTTQEVAELALAAPSSRASAYATAEGRAVVVIETMGSVEETLAFEVDVAGRSSTQLLLREPRRGASAVPAPNATLALVGGEHLDGTPARTVETLWVE
jgi:hypothetical protein